MLSQRVANMVFVVIVLCACGYFAWVAQGFTTSGLLASAGLPSKFFPQLMLGLAALCALIVGYSYLKHGSAGGDEGEAVFADGREARQGLLMLFVAVGCYAIWRYVGFLPMACVLGPLSLLAMGVRTPLVYAVVLALTAVVTAIFMFGLGVQLI
ncbi:MAG: tripartite tricarboxylate transporter TctB family protein [Pseudomonadota bacterium]